MCVKHTLKLDIQANYNKKVVEISNPNDTLSHELKDDFDGKVEVFVTKNNYKEDGAMGLYYQLQLTCD